MSPEAEALLQTICADIERYDQSIVGCAELLLLVSPNDPIGVQYGHIFVTAVRQGWSFEFRNDGTVRFASLNRNKVAVAWDQSEIEEVREAGS